MQRVFQISLVWFPVAHDSCSVWVGWFFSPLLPFFTGLVINERDALLQSYLFILINLSVAGQTVAVKMTSLAVEMNLMTLVALPTFRGTVCVNVHVCVSH